MQEMKVTELLLFLVSCLVTIVKIYRMRQRHLSSFLSFFFIKRKRLFRLDTKLQFRKINVHS